MKYAVVVVVKAVFELAASALVNGQLLLFSFRKLLHIFGVHFGK